MSIEFWITTLVVVVMPGPGLLLTVAMSLAHGARTGLVAVAGCALGILPHLAAAVTGLAALLHTSAVAFGVVKYLGVAYLLYMAWRMWRDGDGRLDDTAPRPRSARELVTTAVLINLLNPKLTLFFLAFLPQFVRAGQPGAHLHMLGLGAVFIAVTAAVFAVCAQFAALLREGVLARPRVMRWTQRGFAAVFCGLAVRLATVER